MRLVAIYNAWSDCTDLLKKSIDTILPCVDGVFIVWSNASNYGQNIPFTFRYDHPKVKFFHVEPMRLRPPAFNETMKRNFGLQQAKEYTHFLIMDCDEFYFYDEVMAEKERIESEDLNGTVCRLKVYIKEPTLWCEDHTLVPFIQKNCNNVSVGHFKYYPYAYDQNREAHIDPTRRPSHKDKIGFSDLYMHHMSYVRKDIMLKINNSTANLRRSMATILSDMDNAKPGYVSQLYHKELNECKDYFKIKEDD
jgi:hypothetical protein